MVISASMSSKASSTTSQMSNGDGFHLLEEIQARGLTGMKIVMMTGYADISTTKLQELGAMKVLSKPFSIDAVLEIIEDK